MSYYLKQHIDFDKHNEEVQKVWAAYHEGKPYRVPITVTGSITNLLCNPEVNTTGYDFKDFFTNPQAQLECWLAFLKWTRYNWICDLEMGPPQNGWHISISFQNSYEAGWFGCPIQYAEGVVPDTVPILKQRKESLYDLEDPDPLKGNLMAVEMEFFHYMQDTCPGMEFEGLPVIAPNGVPGEGTDGPFTVACNLRGTTECCIDMIEDPNYFHDLMNYVTRNTIRRMKALRQWRWEREPNSADKGRFKMPAWGFADDSAGLLSVEQYREFVLPYHRQLAEEFSDGGHISVHLCGDATHLFPFMKKHLNVYAFDTGFPVNFGQLREQLGPEVQINGGPPVMILQNESPATVREKVKSICQSGVMEGGRFILREANNLAPCTPVENLLAMYEAGKEFGTY